MKNYKEFIWHSGDWNYNNNGNGNKLANNGIKIIANANYISSARLIDTQKLVSVFVEVIDYSCNTNGVSCKTELLKPSTWYDIQIPEKNEEFTIVGIEKGLGKIKLDVNTAGVYLEIQFKYGLTESTQNTLGYIMKFEERSNFND
ncbi:hypothetical protein [Flavobacterium sp. N2038]|uniref:hypothetical protein n=1 Tax=Flavobacterium sp. N2038 TaxID=2986829 RepID=UPI002224F1A3|nr:hypothetical protein [Flavobacterium sp. N2038]